VLTADLGERPVRWHRVALIPFGPAEAQLGLQLPPVRTAVPLMARSFTVGPDGSLWVLDAVKHRVAHYSANGAYVGEVGGLRFDRFHPQPRDLAFWSGRLFVLHQFHLAASFRELLDDHFGPVLELESEADPLAMTTLFPSKGEPVGLADGVAALDRLGSGPIGVGRVTPGGGAPGAGGGGLTRPGSRSTMDLPWAGECR
jgi:hypothetical protein